MTRVIRFMSAREALSLAISRKTLHNTTDHHNEGGNQTDSVGFCFIVDDNDLSNQEAIHEAATYLSGIVSMDTCLIGIIKDDYRASFHDGFGMYSAGKKHELSITAYSLDTFIEWSLYAPESLEIGGFMLPFISSMNWHAPILIASSTVEVSVKEEV